MVNQFAQIEQSMNAVERILHYTDLPSEAAAVTKHDPPPSWPDKGEIQFTNVKMQYREKLPLVLDGVSFHIRPGEKVHVAILCCFSFELTASVRLVLSVELEPVCSSFTISKIILTILTGKSSLLQVLFRQVTVFENTADVVSYLCSIQYCGADGR
jgi:hypothetical protein